VNNNLRKIINKKKLFRSYKKVINKNQEEKRVRIKNLIIKAVIFKRKKSIIKMLVNNHNLTKTQGILVEMHIK